MLAAGARGSIIALPVPVLTAVFANSFTLRSICCGCLQAVVVVVVLGRIVWFGDYFRRCWKGTSGGTQRRHRTWQTARRSSNRLQEGKPERHHRLLDREAHRLDIILVGGSIALAAWTQLFVADSQRLSDRTLNLLLAGAACLIAGPLVWRSEGGHLTMMGRLSSLEVGFTLIAATLASVAVDLDNDVAMTVALVAMVVVGVRDLFALRGWVRDTHKLLDFVAA